MRTIVFYLAVIIAFILLSHSSKAQSTRINIKENEEFIYEWTEKEVFHPESQKPRTDSYQLNRFSIIFGKIESNKISFTAKFLEKSEKYLQSDDIYGKDYAFPQLVNYFWEMPDYATSEEILYPIQFNYELNLKSLKIELKNRIEILEQCHKILTTKGYSEVIRSEVIKKINSKTLQQQSELFLKPFLFRYIDIDQQITNHPDYPNIDFTVQKLNAEIIELKSLPTDTAKKMICQIDQQTGLLYHFSEVKALKEVEEGSSISLYQFNGKIEKVSELILIRKQFQKPSTIIVCGRIENPINNHIMLYTMNKAFGREPDGKDVYLDKEGNFRIETKLLHSGLVILVQPNKKQNINTAAFLLYAEPGDSIYIKTAFIQKKIDVGTKVNKDEFNLHKKYNFSNSTISVSKKDKNAYIQILTNKSTRNDTIVEMPQDIMMYESVEFSGDHKAEAIFLMKYQQEWGLPPFNTTYNSIYFNEGTPEIETYFKALDKLHAMISADKKTMSPVSATYLEHEIQALLYTSLYKAMPASLLTNGISFNGSIIPANLESMVKNTLDTLKIQRIYNDYGIFSRELASIFVWYKYNQNASLNQMVIFSGNSIPVQDLEQKIQFSKMILSGSMLYRSIAQNLCSATLNSGNMFTNTSSVWKPYALDMLGLMQKRSNDIEFNQEIESVFSNQFKWENSRYIPETSLLNLQHVETKLNTFIHKKTSIVFVGTNWSSGRYEMDDAVKEYSEFNFVLINEGSNFDLWKGWNDRAESMSKQLFLLNDSVKLSDVFQDKLNSFIIYNASGERIGVEKDLEKAIKIAKESLKSPKKEINKSTLQGIIIFLAGSMLLFLILFLAYKYRMKQRLKKQMQEKRLRELQMAAIRAQMNPHFLFNSLNSVQNLIQQNRAQEAHLYLSDFAGLIRKVLRNSDKEEVSLAEELETLEQYLNLEKLRFDFEYTIEVDQGIDQSLFMVPSMILQPAAENSILHGLQHKTGNKKIMIRISKLDSAIQIVIEDNGIGIEAAQKLKTNSNGVGLKMNKERIQLMEEKYGGNYSFKLIDLTKQNGEGTRIEIFIPEE